MTTRKYVKKTDVSKLVRKAELKVLRKHKRARQSKPLFFAACVAKLLAEDIRTLTNELIAQNCEVARLRNGMLQMLHSKKSTKQSNGTSKQRSSSRAAGRN